MSIKGSPQLVEAQPDNFRLILDIRRESLFDLELSDIPVYVAKELKLQQLIEPIKRRNFLNEVTNIFLLARKDMPLDLDRLIVAYYRLYGGWFPRSFFEETVEQLKKEKFVTSSPQTPTYFFGTKKLTQAHRVYVDRYLFEISSQEFFGSVDGHFNWIRGPYLDNDESTKVGRFDSEIVGEVINAIKTNRCEVYRRKKKTAEARKRKLQKRKEKTRPKSDETTYGPDFIDDSSETSTGDGTIVFEGNGDFTGDRD